MAETLNVTGTVQHQYPDHDTIELIRGQRGGYGWVIKVRGPDADELLARANRIDRELRTTYPQPGEGG